MKVVESFKYLGALLHWKQDASSAWSDRENTGFKAFGTLLCSLVLVPFLPLRRVIDVTNAIGHFPEVAREIRKIPTDPVNG